MSVLICVDTVRNIRELSKIKSSISRCDSVPLPLLPHCDFTASWRLECSACLVTAHKCLYWFPYYWIAVNLYWRLLAFATLKQRKVIGIQDVKEGLLTSGLYRYFRHPINTGILWVTGLALVMRNPDGLLMFPAVFVISFAGTILEERNDMCVRFREQYQAYRQTTRMFGPIWLWSIIVVSILLLSGLAWSMKID